MVKQAPPNQRFLQSPIHKPSDRGTRIGRGSGTRVGGGYAPLVDAHDKSDADPDIKTPVSMETPNGTRLGREAVASLELEQTRMNFTLMSETLTDEIDRQKESMETDNEYKEHKGDKKDREDMLGLEPIKELGRGGMGIVYLAEKVRRASDGTEVIRVPVAVKMLNFDDALKTAPTVQARRTMKKDLYRRFLREVQMVSRLDHPNIVRITDFGEGKIEIMNDKADSVEVNMQEYKSAMTNEGPFYVMEFLDGADMSKIINNTGPLSWSQARPLMIQVCEGLEYAHNFVMKNPKGGEETPYPIIHRDIKPENLFVTNGMKGRQTVKILDFGIATVMEKTMSETTHSGGAIMGTPYYMPPEQACGATIDNRSDIYALGATMYHVLTGCTVFNGNLTELLLKLMNEKPIPLRERRPDLNIPEKAERIIMKCLEKDPVKRYQSMEELKEAIMQASDNSTNFDASNNSPASNSASFVHQDSQKITPNRTITTKEGEVISVAFRRQKRRKLFRRAMIGLGGFVAAGTITVVLMSKNPRKIDNNNNSRPNTAVKDMRHTKMPMERHVQDRIANRNMPAPMKEEKKRTITFVTNLKDVQVFSGDRFFCTTGNDGKCTIKLQKGQKLDLVFRKKGYKDKKLPVLEDTSGSIAVTLERNLIWRGSKGKKTDQTMKKRRKGSGNVKAKRNVKPVWESQIKKRRKSRHTKRVKLKPVWK